MRFTPLHAAFLTTSFQSLIVPPPCAACYAVMTLPRPPAGNLQGGQPAGDAAALRRLWAFVLKAVNTATPSLRGGPVDVGREGLASSRGWEGRCLKYKSGPVPWGPAGAERRQPPLKLALSAVGAPFCVVGLVFEHVIDQGCWAPCLMITVRQGGSG